MKKLVLALAVICGFATMANAQEDGKVWFGGSVGFETSKVKNGSSFTSYNIIPEIGYGLSNRFGLGLRLGYTHNEFSNNEGKKLKTDGLLVNPFVRYYVYKGGIGGIFMDGGAGYGYSKNKYTDIKTHIINVGIRPGVAINLSNRLSLTGKFGFLGYEYEKIGSTKINGFIADFDLNQVELGVNIRF